MVFTLSPPPACKESFILNPFALLTPPRACVVPEWFNIEERQMSDSRTHAEDKNTWALCIPRPGPTWRGHAEQGGQACGR